ncbi:coiled-coil domain-containing protein 86 [Austrofundulus limnaeus]|uniref:Coiled-coil domain-containing protein 86 n=1 Tax=Austrofundulus limnaeus TaxID=52670 RepID=A0A2I4B600_AUSLI|nr:PREDICTED: coiled-coil domain-containing protein 86-like [Austrofundulus limnaeus]
MPKRKKAAAAENTASESGEEQVENPTSDTRRTRSGRTVRTPAALLDSQLPVRTPSRRTRRSVLQELPAVEEENTKVPERKLECSVEESGLSEPETAEPPTEEEVSSAETDPTQGGGDIQIPRPVPAETVPSGSETIPKKKKTTAPQEPSTKQIPLGKPKSGRVWKDRNKQRFSAMVRDKPLCSSWEKKMQAKQEKQLVKQFTTRLKEEKNQKKEEKRKRREENLRRRAENERKSEIVQVIRNTAKIKRMKKKQLRKIEKRDTLALLQKTQKQNVKNKKTQKHVQQDLT